jgi:excisionase family DNA binding protein
MNNDLNKTLYNIEDLASLLKISKATVYRMVESKQISFIRVGKSIRFSEKDVKEYIAKNSSA